VEDSSQSYEIQFYLFIHEFETSLGYIVSLR
jgi:hypothetical protein